MLYLPSKSKKHLEDIIIYELVFLKTFLAKLMYYVSNNHYLISMQTIRS